MHRDKRRPAGADRRQRQFILARQVEESHVRREARQVPQRVSHDRRHVAGHAKVMQVAQEETPGWRAVAFVAVDADNAGGGSRQDDGRET
jgi:hypothetical protein